MAELESHAPEVARLDAHLLRANLSRDACDALDWGGSYVGVAGMAMVSAPAVGALMGGICVACWAISKVLC